MLSNITEQFCMLFEVPPDINVVAQSYIGLSTRPTHCNRNPGALYTGLYFGRDLAADSEEAKLPLHGPNQWPPEVILNCFASHMYQRLMTHMQPDSHDLLWV